MENVKFSYFDLLINNVSIDILEHGYILADETWKHYNVTSPFNRLYFVLDGEGYIYNRSQRITLEKGNVYLIPANLENNYVCDGSLEKFYLHFRVEVFHGFDVFETLDSCLILPFDPLELQNFIEKAKSSRVEDIIYCKGYLLQRAAGFIGEFSTDIDPQFHKAFKYKNIFAYLKNHCNAGITIKELAQYGGFTVQNFSKSFKKDMGITVKEYLEKVLADKAKEKLLLTDELVKKIAYDLKFSDEFYFSRFFKRHTGLSPKDYRMKNRVV